LNSNPIVWSRRSGRHSRDPHGNRQRHDCSRDQRHRGGANTERPAQLHQVSAPARRHSPHPNAQLQAPRHDPEHALHAPRPGKIKSRINSNINCVLLSVFSYLFKNKTMGVSASAHN